MMKTHRSLVVAAVAIAASGLGASPAAAQARPVGPTQTHYQIAVMERVLEGAVEHGAALVRDRLQAIAPDAPAQMLILDNPRVRGFRLEGYGVFFDVEVPSLNGTLTWSLRTLDQNDLGLQSALNMLKTRLDPADVDLQQALRRVELQVGPAKAVPASAPAPAPSPSAAPLRPNPRRAAAGAPDRTVAATSVAPAAAPADAAPAAAPRADDSILENPNQVYRAEVLQALTDAMLDYSGPLEISNDQWITIAARGIQDRPRLGPPDNDVQTVILRVRGADLAAFLAKQISRDEVISRIDRRVF